MYYRIVERGHTNFTVESRPWWRPFWFTEDLGVYEHSTFVNYSNWTTPQGALNALACLKETRRRIEVRRLQAAGRFFPRVIHRERVDKEGFTHSLKVSLTS